MFAIVLVYSCPLQLLHIRPDKLSMKLTVLKFEKLHEFQLFPAAPIRKTFTLFYYLNHSRTWRKRDVKTKMSMKMVGTWNEIHYCQQQWQKYSFRSKWILPYRCVLCCFFFVNKINCYSRNQWKSTHKNFKNIQSLFFCIVTLEQRTLFCFHFASNSFETEKHCEFSTFYWFLLKMYGYFPLWCVDSFCVYL